MTYDPMAMVAEFHDKFHKDGPTRHLLATEIEDVDRRSRLIIEEFQEVDEVLLSMANGIESGYEPENYLPELAKELSDLLYVIYGTADEFGIPLYEVFEEVHRSNMSKVWPDGTVHYNEYGKILKPPTYAEANIKKVWDEYYP